MAKFKLGGAAKPRRVRIRYSIPGLERTRTLDPAGYEFLTAMVKRWKLPFEFEKRDEWVFLKPQGLVLNATAIGRWNEQRVERSSVEMQIAEYTERLTALKEQIANRPRFQVLGKDVIERFVGTLETWDEVLESGTAGKEMNLAAPRFKVPPDAQMAIRLQPVRFRKYIMGKEFWGITPPMPFTLHATHLMSQLAGHPHVYAAELKLCVGDAVFDYGNPFQVTGMLREWYVGYAPHDVADRDWIAHSQMWWRANGEAWLARGDCHIIEAPDKYREKSELGVLTAAELEQFKASKSWVKGKTLPVIQEGPRMEAREQYSQMQWQEVLAPEPGAMCVIGEHALAQARCTSGDGGGRILSVSFCACHLAEMGLDIPEESGMLRPAVGKAMPYAGDPQRCNIGQIRHNSIPTLDAAYTVRNLGHVCAGHAYRYGALALLEENPLVEMDRLVLAGEQGAGVKLDKVVYDARFPNRGLTGWLTPCTKCGEPLDDHWGLTCPNEPYFELAANSQFNRKEVPLRSRFDFAGYEAVANEVEVFKATFKANPKDRSGGSFGQMVRRLVAQDGTSLDDKDGRREFWVVDTLRKFGRDVAPDSTCIDCGGQWLDAAHGGTGSHNGPDCWVA